MTGEGTLRRRPPLTPRVETSNDWFADRAQLVIQPSDRLCCFGSNHLALHEGRMIRYRYLRLTLNEEAMVGSKVM